MRSAHRQAGDDRVDFPDGRQRPGGQAVANDRASRRGVQLIAVECYPGPASVAEPLLHICLAVTVGVAKGDNGAAGRAAATALCVNEYISVGCDNDMTRPAQSFGEYRRAKALRQLQCRGTHWPAHFLRSSILTVAGCSYNEQKKQAVFH